eukprot:3214440-Prymnesium_polylepis.1
MSGKSGQLASASHASCAAPAFHTRARASSDCHARRARHAQPSSCTVGSCRHGDVAAAARSIGGKCKGLRGDAVGCKRKRAAVRVAADVQPAARRGCGRPTPPHPPPRASPLRPHRAPSSRSLRIPAGHVDQGSGSRPSGCKPTREGGAKRARVGRRRRRAQGRGSGSLERAGQRRAAQRARAAVLHSECSRQRERAARLWTRVGRTCVCTAWSSTCRDIAAHTTACIFSALSAALTPSRSPCARLATQRQPSAASGA